MYIRVIETDEKLEWNFIVNYWEDHQKLMLSGWSISPQKSKLLMVDKPEYWIQCSWELVIFEEKIEIMCQVEWWHGTLFATNDSVYQKLQLWRYPEISFYNCLLYILFMSGEWMWEKLVRLKNLQQEPEKPFLLKL